VGYSQNAGLVTSASLSQNNFLGSGNRFSVGLSRNNYTKSIQFSYLDPYFTDDGISVGYSLAYSDYSQSTTSTARYGSGNASGEVTFGFPVSEAISISTGLGISRSELTTYDGSTPPQVINYLVNTWGDRLRNTVFIPDNVNNDNDPTTPASNDNPPGGDPDPLIPSLGNQRQWVVNAWTARANWGYDTRNDYLLPSSGMLHHIYAEASLPGSDLEYFRVGYDFEHYWHPSFARWMILKTAVSLGYGDSYGDTHKAQCYSYSYQGFPIPGTLGPCGLPFFKNFYAGGPGSVRGFTANTLGPTTIFGGFSQVQPLGGAVKTTGTFEIYFPRLLAGVQGSRLSAFVDYGYVFPRPGEFAFNQFRITTGLALQWQSPMGPISISYAIPLDYGRCEGGPFPACTSDDIERLQFTFGNNQ
jgi:outer membrane protein insertion porin family